MPLIRGVRFNQIVIMTAYDLQQKFMTESHEETHFRGGVPNPVYIQWLENRLLEQINQIQ